MRLSVASLCTLLVLAAAPATAQTIALNGVAPPTGVTVAAAAPVTVDVAGGPGNTTDWIALYATGAGDASYLTWSYLNGTTSPPAGGLASATLIRTAPVVPGTYEWRLFATNSFTRIATSATLTVTASAAVVTVNGVAAPSPTSGVAGGTLTVTVTNGPGQPTDWVALAPVGAPDATVLDWRYLSGTTVAPTTGLTSASLTFLAPVTPGAYEVRFFAVNSYARLATSGVVTVSASSAALTVNGVAPPTAVAVNAGTFATVGVTDGPGHPGDWVGLYAANSPDTAILAWRYLNGSTTVPVSGFTSATLTFGVPLTPGSYEFRFFSANSYTRLATSSSMVVAAAAAQLSVNGVVAPAAATALPGTPAVVSVAAGPGNPADWVGLYANGADDAAMLDWRYLNDTATLPSTGLTTGTLHFAVPTTAGNYEFRFFLDNSYGRLATSGAMVVPQTPARIAVNGTAPPTSVTVAPASTITATLTGGPGNATDWVALAAQGAPNASYVSWQYLNGTPVAPIAGLTGGTLSFTVPSTAGTYELRFFASNSYQRITTSAAIVASTAPPVVSIAMTEPYPGTTFNAPASLALAATTTITGGTLQRVEFYTGPTLIGTATAAPYAVTWTAPPEGLHVLTAVAVDQTSAITTSALHLVTIAPAGATLGTLAEPVASPPGGVYGPGQQVTLAAAPGATIHYAVDGSEPGLSSPVYSAPLTLALSIDVRALAVQPGWTDSPLAMNAYTLDIAPPAIVARISPPPNAAGWNSTPVTVSFDCVDQSVVATCPAPVLVTQDGAGQLVSVTATDVLGFQGSLSVTVNLDSVPPVVALISPTHDVSTSASAVPMQATAADALSGLGGATCDGLAVVGGGSAFMCTVTLDPGLNSVVVTAVDVAGNSASVGRRLTRQTTPTALAIAPSSLAMAVGDLHALHVTTDAGLPATGLTWTTSNASVISLDPANDGAIVAEALGQATITATLDGLSAQAVVRVLPGGVAIGEPIWTVAPPTPGLSAMPPMSAHPVTDEDPDLFVFDAADHNNSEDKRVRAVRGADGATLWSESVRTSAGMRGGVADAYGGLVLAVPDANSRVTTVRRIGGNIPPWEYVTPGSAVSVPATAPDGTVYTLEDLGEGSLFVTLLDGATGHLKARQPLPTSDSTTVRRGSCSGTEGGPGGGWVSAIVVLENGDAVLLHTEEHTRSTYTCNTVTGGAITATTNSSTLRSVRITPAGVMTSAELHRGSSSAGQVPSNGYWPFASATGTVLAPLGGGEVLVQWNTIRGYQITDDVPYPDWDQTLARLGPSGGIQATRPFAREEVLDVAMSTSGDDFYLRHSPHGTGDGQLESIDRQTLATRWTTGDVAAQPIQGLDNGGVQLLQIDAASVALQERDADGIVVGSHPTSLVSPVVVLRDQGVVHGIGNGGALEMISATAASPASEWSFDDGVFSTCTPPVLIDDAWPFDARRSIGLPRRTAPYTFAFLDDGTDIRPNARWKSNGGADFQRDGGRDAFAAWQTAAEYSGLPYRFSEVQSDPDLQVKKANLVEEYQVVQSAAGVFEPLDILPNRRSARGVIALSTSEQVIYQKIGYFKSAMHEVGHALGLTHPWSPLRDIPESFPIKRGGTVMNNLAYVKPAAGQTQPGAYFRDDPFGNVAKRPTICDIYGVVDAAYRQ